MIWDENGNLKNPYDLPPEELRRQEESYRAQKLFARTGDIPNWSDWGFEGIETSPHCRLLPYHPSHHNHGADGYMGGNSTAFRE